MANSPDRSQIHIDRALTDVSVLYMQESTQFIADKIFPPLPVSKQSGLYFKYDKGDTLRIHSEVRAPGTESAKRVHSINQGSYNATKYAISEVVADDDVANSDEAIDLMEDAAQICMGDILTAKELDFFTKTFTTSVWSDDVTPSTLWDASGSAPIDDIELQIITMQGNTGVNKRDMTLTFDPRTWNAVKNNEAVIDRIKYTQKGVVSEDLVASLLGIKQVLVAGAVVNSAKQGQTASIGYMATSGGALLTYAPSTPSKKRPAAGYTFKWSGAGNSAGIYTRKMYKEELEGTIVEVNNAYEHNIVATDCGIYFTGTIS